MVCQLSQNSTVCGILIHLLTEMGKLLFKSNSLLITITCNKKYFVTVTYYLENKVTVIILHIILPSKTTQQFSNNVSYSYHIEENLANEQHFT